MSVESDVIITAGLLGVVSIAQLFDIIRMVVPRVQAGRNILGLGADSTSSKIYLFVLLALILLETRWFFVNGLNSKPVENILLMLIVVEGLIRLLMVDNQPSFKQKEKSN